MPKNRMSLCCGAKPYKVVRWRDRHQLHARLHKMLQITLKTKNDESKASNRATCSEMYLILFIKMCVRLTNRIRYIPFLPSVRNDNIINCAMYAEGVCVVCDGTKPHSRSQCCTHAHAHAHQPCMDDFGRDTASYRWGTWSAYMLRAIRGR